MMVFISYLSRPQNKYTSSLGIVISTFHIRKLRPGKEVKFFLIQFTELVRQIRNYLFCLMSFSLNLSKILGY